MENLDQPVFHILLVGCLEQRTQSEKIKDGYENFSSCNGIYNFSS